jgi:hypothetical protein
MHKARSKEDLAEVMMRPPSKPLKVRVEHRGRRLNARLIASETGWELKVVQRANDPKVVTAFQGSGPPQAGEPINVDFVGNRFAELGAKMSWFRSGFLVLFAAFGYRFSFDPAVAIVKRQILSHESRLIYSFTIEIPQSLAWSDWRILEIPEPRCTGVLFGRYVMLYPHRGDVQVYERLEAAIKSQTRQTPAVVTAQSFELTNRAVVRIRARRPRPRLMHSPRFAIAQLSLCDPGTLADGCHNEGPCWSAALDRC